MRANTDIEKFILNYGNDDRGDDEYDDDDNGISIATDLYEDDGEQQQYEQVGAMEPVFAVTTKKRSRIDVIASREDNDFMRLLAGTLDVDLEDLYEHEDIDGVIQREQDTATEVKRRRLLDEDRRRRIANIQNQIDVLKSRLVSAGDQERVDGAFLELNKLRALVGDSDSVLYTRLVYTYADYESVLSPDTESSQLIDIMERLYRENGDQPRDFMRQLASASIDREDKKAMRGIVINALWQRDIGRTRNIKTYIEVDDDADENFKTEVLRIKQEADTIHETPVKTEFNPFVVDSVGRYVTTGVRITPKYDSYTSYMTALIRARDDIMTRNELTKGVNITSIHTPELNRRISALTNPNITRIIDTSHDYFKELYYGANDAVTQYRDLIKNNSTNSLSRYETDLDQYGALLRRSLDLSEKRLALVLEQTIDIFNTMNREPSQLINTQALVRYKDTTMIRNGKVTRPDIIVDVIKEDASDFLLYYTSWSDRSIEAPLDNYLAMCDLFLSLADYIRKQNADLKQQIAVENQRLHQLMVESTEIDDEGRDTRRIYTSIRIKPRVLAKMDEAYRLVTEYCVNLRGLPLVAFKTPRAVEAGLAGDFACYVDALMTDNDTRKPTSYKSRLDHEGAVKRKSEMMNRLKAYSYTTRYDGTPMNRYTFFKNTRDSNSRGGGGGGSRSALFSSGGRESFFTLDK